jgi:signal transduction histidine kinase
MTLAREAEIRALGLVSQPAPDALHHLVRAAARVTGAAHARVNIVTETEQHTLVSTDGDTASQVVEDSLCATIVRELPRQQVVPDTTQDPRFSSSPFVTSGSVTSYAASQLVTRRGVPVGTLCVYSPDHREIDDTAMEVLSDLAAGVMDILETSSRRDELHEVVVELTDGSRELRRSNEHLAAFAGQVSHDIKGPLSAVLMALQLIDDDLSESKVPAAPHRVELLRRAITASVRMEAMVSGLMEFAALGGRISSARVDMDGVVKDVLVDLAAAAGEAYVEVGELPAVWGDEVQLRALVQNLLANAFKYAGATPDTHIRVSGLRHGGRVRVSVSDNGPGVPQGERASIFAIMVRGSETGDGDVEGLGIGLATCRRIAQAHGGDIGVTDSDEGGAEFWFELPDDRDR